MKSVRASALKINRKNIYRESKLEEKDLYLAELIISTFKKHPAYGHKRLAWHLGVNRKRVLRVMKKYNIKPPRRKVKPKWITVTTKNKHEFTNLIKNIIPTDKNQIFVSDLTYIKFKQKFIYLGGVEDIYTREIKAHGISLKHDSNLALDLIQESFKPNTPKIFHSDQGTEFMAKQVTSFIEKNNTKISVSDKGSPWQNGYKESFFGRFKEEFGNPNRFNTLPELIEEIHQKINYYNNKRIHTALKMPPAVFATSV